MKQLHGHESKHPRMKIQKDGVAFMRPVMSNICHNLSEVLFNCS